MPRHRSLALAALAAMTLTSCTSDRLGGLRDVPVSEITLAEPLVAEAKLGKRIAELRRDPSKTQELAGVLAEYALVAQELGHWQETQKLAEEALHLLDPMDRSSRSFFLVSRARCQLFGLQGLHGTRVNRELIKGNWPPLDKAQIYNDLANDCEPVYSKAAMGNALAGLVLRLKATGPRSLEVAESLETIAEAVSSQPDNTDVVYKVLGLPVPKTTNRSGADLSNKCRRRAFQLREEKLGPNSFWVAASLGQSEPERLRALSIYQHLFGSNSSQAACIYQSLAFTTNERNKKQYEERATMCDALIQAGGDPLKTAYVYVKSSLPEEYRYGQHDVLTEALRQLRIAPPEIQEYKVHYGSQGWTIDGLKLGVPEFDNLYGTATCSFESQLGFDDIRLEAFHHHKVVLEMRVPSIGGDHLTWSVLGPGKLRFRQEGSKEQGYQELTYQWNGKTFELIDGKPGNTDRQLVKAAIDDAVNGYGWYGMLGYHLVDQKLIRDALIRGNAAAEKLCNEGHPREAAQRMRTVFVCTSDLIDEASTGIQMPLEDDGKDDFAKWARSWSHDSHICHVNLSPAMWKPLLKNYAMFCDKAGEHQKSVAATKAVS